MPATPTSRWCSPRATPRRAPRWPSCTRAWRRPTRAWCSTRTNPPCSTGSTWCSAACPTARRRRSCRRCGSRVKWVVDLAADFRLARRRALPDLVRRGARRPRAAAPSSPTACPSCSGPRSPGATAVAAPGCYPTAAALALAPLLRAGLVETDRASIVDAASGVSGAGRPPKANTTFCAVDEDFTAYGLLDHRHTPEIEQTLARSAAPADDVRCCSRPHLAPMNRGILATCYARPTGAERSTDDAARAATATPTPTSRSWSSPTGRRRPRRRSAPTPPTSPCGHDPRTGWVVAIAAIDNLAKGASGQAVQCANIARSASPETDRASPTVGGLPMSVTAAAGLRRRRHRRRHQGERRASTSSLVATADGRPVAAAGVFTSNQMTAAPVHRHPVAPRRPTGGRAAAVILNSGNANAATGEPGMRRRRGDVRPRGRRARRATATRCSCARPASSASRCRSTRSSAAIPGSWPPRVGRRRRPTRPRPSAPPTPHRKEVVVDAATASSSAAWPRARRCSRPTWPRCSPCSPPTPTADPGAAARPRCVAGVDRLVQRADDRRLHVHQRHRAAPGQRRAPARSTPDALDAAVAEACADLAAQMAGDAEGATKVVRLDRDRRRLRRRGASRRAAQGRREPAGASAPGTARTRTGAASPASSAAPASRFDPTLVSICLRRRRRSAAGGVEIDHDTRRRGRAHGRPRTSRSSPTSASAPGRARSSPTTSPTPTSTRTWARRDAPSPRTPDAAVPRAAEPAEVLVEALPYIRRFCGHDRRREVRRQRHDRPRPGRAASPRTSCCCTRSASGRSWCTAAVPRSATCMERLGMEPEFLDGLRVTDAETLDIARMVLVGKVNREIVVGHQRPRPAGRRPLGRGRRAHRGRASAIPSSASSATSPRSNPAIIDRLLAENLIPVVSTIGADAAGPGLQHQRRHRRRRHRRGARRREDRLPHRRRRACCATSTTPTR